MVVAQTFEEAEIATKSRVEKERMMVGCFDWLVLKSLIRIHFQRVATEPRDAVYVIWDGWHGGRARLGGAHLVFPVK